MLDTNACVAHLRQVDSPVAHRLAVLPIAEVALCAIVKAELYFGVERSANAVENRARLEIFLAPFVSLPFDDQAAELYGHLRAQLAAQGQMIGPNDLLIASIALAHDVTLVTQNTREFSRVAGLRLEDWMA